jgi:hypothetical protein
MPSTGVVLDESTGDVRRQLLPLGARTSNGSADRRSSVGADTELLREQINDRLAVYSNTIVALTVLIQHLSASVSFGSYRDMTVSIYRIPCITVRWSNFDLWDPKMGVFLQSTEATPCGDPLK